MAAEKNEIFLNQGYHENQKWMFTQKETVQLKSSKRLQIGTFMFLRNVATKKYLNADTSHHSAFLDDQRRLILETEQKESQLMKFFVVNQTNGQEILFCLSCF